MGGYGKITLIVPAVATKVEVMKAYVDALAAVGRKPPRTPSATAVALCQLVSETPDWTWRARWIQWGRWCAQDQSLTAIKGEYELATFRTACRRAVSGAFGPAAGHPEARCSAHASKGNLNGRD